MVYWKILIPIFFAMMYLLFTLTIKLGRAFKPFFNDLAQALFVDGAGYFLTLLDSPSWLIVLLSSGIGNGIREVAAFVPILGFLYLFIAVLEESGYMARATFAMDRLMRVLGLPGKTFVPMILGFGCNVPAMMATRTLERPLVDYSGKSIYDLRCAPGGVYAIRRGVFSGQC